MEFVNHIRVWDYKRAPDELKALSTNGGDEDWVALVPPRYQDMYVGWLDSGSFGCYCIDVYDHPELPGYKIHIGCHA